MDFWAVAVTLLGAFTLLFLYVKKQQSFWARRGIRSPPFLFGVGHSLDRFWQKVAATVVFTRFYRESKDDIVGLYFFTKPVAMVRNVNLVKRIMISDFDHFISRGVYYNEKDDPVSAHLFSLSGSKWRKLRTKLTPTFTSGKMKMMLPIIVEISKRFAETFAEETAANPKGFEIKQLTSRFTTDVIGNCAFGIECNSLKEPKNNEYRLINDKAFRRPLWKIIVLHFAQNFPEVARKLRVQSSSEGMNEFYSNMVRATMESRRKNPETRNDFMNTLLKMHDNPSTEAERVTFNEIVAQSFLFFLAGFETSSSTMMFALYELAMNPEIQEQTVDHIRKVLQRHNNELTYDCLQEMDFLEQVVNETLRKFPPVPTLLRRVTKDYKVPDTDGLVLPKGLLTLIPVHAIHMDPEYYPEPEKFDPTRFDPIKVRERPDSTFMSFGEGPRICIGLRFGMMQAKVGLVALLSQFQFRPMEKQQPIVFDRLSSVLAPEGGLFLRVEKRQDRDRIDFL